MSDEMIDGVALASAMKRLSALGEYLLIDDIKDLGKVDHFHHYLVGLILWVMGIGGEMAGKFIELINGLIPPPKPPPQTQVELRVGVPSPSQAPGYYLAGGERVKDGMPLEYASKKMAVF